MKRIHHGAWLLITTFVVYTAVFGATARQWQSGKLLDTEQQKVKEGSTTTYNTDGQAKDKGNGKTNYFAEYDSNDN